MKKHRANGRDWFSPFNLRRAFNAGLLVSAILFSITLPLWLTLAQTKYYSGQIVSRHAVTNEDQSVTFTFVVNEDGGGLAQWHVPVSQFNYVTTPTFTKVKVRVRGGPFFTHFPPELVAP